MEDKNKMGWVPLLSLTCPNGYTHGIKSNTVGVMGWEEEE